MLEDFYPTPESLIRKMIHGLSLKDCSAVLEPSAGKGDICSLIAGRVGEDRYGSATGSAAIDVIEINPELQLILKAKGYRLVHDDFLTFKTEKPYDLIIGNFPFSEGDKHLGKALQMIRRNGGTLRALVNAETIRNPYTQLRQSVNAALEQIGAEVEYLVGEFSEAERRTDVEVALVKARIEVDHRSSIVLDGLRKAIEDEQTAAGTAQALAKADYKHALIERFDLEARIGRQLIDEYDALRPYVLPSFEGREYETPLIELKVAGQGYREGRAEQVRSYLTGLRKKYWGSLVTDRRFTERYTSNIHTELDRRLDELTAYDFNAFNIEELEKDLRKRITSGIEAAILELFDKLSREYAYDKSIHNGNTHYYNGWKTNKSWKINSKVILPMYLLNTGWNGNQDFRYERVNELQDMVKVFNYLAASEGTTVNVAQLVASRKDIACSTQHFRNMDFRYFDLTAFKKGTVHIKFKDQRLLDKFNIFGSQRKGWLPPSYGKKNYDEMDREERAVVDEFQGEEAYEQVMKKPEFYLVEDALALLGTGE